MNKVIVAVTIAVLAGGAVGYGAGNSHGLQVALSDTQAKGQPSGTPKVSHAPRPSGGSACQADFAAAGDTYRTTLRDSQATFVTEMKAAVQTYQDTIDATSSSSEDLENSVAHDTFAAAQDAARAKFETARQSARDGLQSALDAKKACAQANGQSHKPSMSPKPSKTPKTSPSHSPAATP